MDPKTPFDRDTIERMVREIVVRRVQAAKSELAIKARVVTLEEIDGKLDGIQQIVVPPRAVITPAVRDVLRERGIAVAYAIPERKTAAAGLTLVVAEAEAVPGVAKMIDGLSTGGGIERLAKTGLAQMVDEMSDEVVRGGKLGLVLTDRPAVAVCLANRRRGVRAVAATDPRTTARDVRAAGANMLVADPTQRSHCELTRTVRQFVAGAPYPCPMESLR